MTVLSHVRALLPGTRRERRWLVVILGGLLLAGIAGGVAWRWNRASEVMPGVVVETNEGGPGAHPVQNADGSWTYTNRLINETSPYLLLHAHNPVDWYPWGPDALERAKREQRLIFLSIGYSTCYWCHVMERKVFSDPAIAALMNQGFINIKVDREERPDLDEVYMTATQMITGSGGWPNSVFLTSDLKPFYAGTYFPPTDQYGRPGFPKVLQALQDAWENRCAEVLSQAEAVTRAIRETQEGPSIPANTAKIDRSFVDRAITRLKERYDAQDGGFSGAPKFPPAAELELLLTEYERTHDSQLLKIVTHTLDAMTYGGIYDHIGGGFHRYSTDSKWLIPHFEKMLYNQSDLAHVYLRAFQITQDPDYRWVAEDILRFVARDMTGPEGGFYSAIDSETDAVEGAFYLWTEQEIRETLGNDAELFLKVYSLTPMPEGHSGVLYLPRPIKDVAEDVRMTPDRLRQVLIPLIERLYRVRQARKPPLVDTKILTSWNGRMIDAFAYAYKVTRNPAYRETAVKAAQFVLHHLRDEGGLLKHTYRNGVVKYNAYQEDYAFLVCGLLGLHQATGDAYWLMEAQALTDLMLARFGDDRHGGFYFTDGTEPLIVRTKSPYDSAIPSGNAVAVHNLLALAQRTGRRAYLDKARQTMRVFSSMMAQAPGGFTHMILAVNTDLTTDWDRVLQGSRDVRVGSSPKASGTREGGMTTDVGLFAPLKAPHSAPSVRGPTNGQEVVHATLTFSPNQPTPGRRFDAILRLQVKPGWHINANPASMKELISTGVTFNADVPIEIISISYPPGTSVKFGFADRPLSVYHGEVVIRATLRLKPEVRPGRSGTLRALLTYQACNDQSCLMPVETVLSVPIISGQKG